MQPGARPRRPQPPSQSARPSRQRQPRARHRGRLRWRSTSRAAPPVAYLLIRMPGASATAIAIVLDGPLGAMARAVPAAGDAPLTTSFTGSAAGGRAPYTYSWDFGDGTTSPLQSPNHIYNSAGTFAVALTIHDASGQTATATASVVVSPSLGATSSAAPTGGNAPLTVAFTGSATGGKAPFTFAWTFGD